MTPAAGGPPHAPGGHEGGYVPGSTQAAPPPGAYVPGSTQAAPPPGAYVPGSTRAAPPPGPGTSQALGTPGRTIGPYVVERELGRGGMGVVLVVRHPSIPRPLAMKVILGDAADAQALQRFGQEAQVMARVRHPNVVVVHELGRAPEGPYLVTELVEGTGLDRRLREGPLEPRQAVTLARALADGLAACHQAGVVHRDLKPANVIVRPDGSPVLLDFGIARDQTAERMTRTGQLMGTPAYMAPEQAEGARLLDSRVDVYGLAAILFECLCGRPPFSQHDPPMVIVKKVLIEEPVWPRATHPAVPRSLEELLRVAMAKTPEARHQGMVALRADLDRWLRGEATWASTRLPRAPGGGRRVAAGAAALVALVALGAWAGLRSAPVAPPPPIDTSAATVAPAPSAATADTPGAAEPRWQDGATQRDRVVAAGRHFKRTGTAWTEEALAYSRHYFSTIPGPVDMLRLEPPVRVTARDPTRRTRVLVGPRGEVALVRADGRIGVWNDLRAVLGKPIEGKEYPQTPPDHEGWLLEQEKVPTSHFAPAVWTAEGLVIGDVELGRFGPGLRRLGPAPRPWKEGDAIVRVLLQVPGSGLLVGTGGLAEDGGVGTVTLAGAPLGTHRLGPPRGAAVSDDGRWLVTTGGAGGGGSSQSTLLVFERGPDGGWSEPREVELTLGTFDAVAFLPGESRFVVGTWNGTLELRDAAAAGAEVGRFFDPKATSFAGRDMGLFAHSAGVHAVLVAGGHVWSGSDGESSDLRSWPVPGPGASSPYTADGILREIPGGVCSLAALDDDLLLVGDGHGRLQVFVVGPR